MPPFSLYNFIPPVNLSNQLVTAYALFDIFLILLLTRSLGGLALKLKQPRVVGEIIAGILLGPTLLGENLSLVIIPAQIRPILSSIATLGLILFMTLAGLEFDASRVKGRVGQASLLAVSSILLPAICALPLAYLMFNPTFAGVNDPSYLAFALLLGAALSVTAFPVMTHILLERQQLNTNLGALAVATAGIMSVLLFAYIALATAVASSAGIIGLMWRLVGTILFVGSALWLIKPWLSHTIPATPNLLTGNHMAIVFGGMVLFGAIADRLGINALLGGFLWGMIISNNHTVRQAIAKRIVDIAMILMLPIFFAFAGFSVNFRLLTIGHLPIVFIVLFTAILSKFLAVLPAKWIGFSIKEVGVLGALFNTRGLLVLIVGLIGLQIDVFTELTFTILAIVALVTNMMTLPILDFLEKD